LGLFHWSDSDPPYSSILACDNLGALEEEDAVFICCGVLECEFTLVLEKIGDRSPLLLRSQGLPIAGSVDLKSASRMIAASTTAATTDVGWPVNCG